MSVGTCELDVWIRQVGGSNLSCECRDLPGLDLSVGHFNLSDGSLHMFIGVQGWVATPKMTLTTHDAEELTQGGHRTNRATQRDTRRNSNGHRNTTQQKKNKNTVTNTAHQSNTELSSTAGHKNRHSRRDRHPTTEHSRKQDMTQNNTANTKTQPT